MNKKVVLEPSFLAFDQYNYLSQLDELKKIGITSIHFDVMDGKFVENVAPFRLDCIEDIIKMNFEITVHIMCYDFLKYANYFKNLPIKAITFQCEAIRNNEDELLESFEILKKNNILVGIAINPETNINKIIKLIELSDIVTIMSVVAGKGGQKFMPIALENLKLINEIKKEKALIVQIDGGVNLENIDLYINDVDRIVSGSSFMSNKNNMLNFIKKINFFCYWKDKI